MIEPLDDKQKMATASMSMGALESLHKTLDYVRDLIEVPGESAVVRAPVDHNLDQAQIALETASLRLQQVCLVLQARMSTDSSPNPERPSDGSE